MTINTPHTKPIISDQKSTVYRGDSLSIMRSLPADSVDAVVTDPPYSSGGLHAGSRARKPSEKYVHGGTKRVYPEFFGDNRDQRSFGIWSSVWMAEAYRITRQGGYLLCFTDWRQLPITSDAAQVAGWTWKGIVVWDKTEGTRPSRGWFRSQSEFVVGAVKGSLGQEQTRDVKDCLPGVFRESVRSSTKLHMTGKPVGLMENLLRVLPENSRVLDPFAGSGTTLIAARNLGHTSIGIEMSPDYCSVIASRLGISCQGADEATWAGRN